MMRSNVKTSSRVISSFAVLWIFCIFYRWILLWNVSYVGKCIVIILSLYVICALFKQSNNFIDWFKREFEVIELWNFYNDIGNRKEQRTIQKGKGFCLRQKSAFVKKESRLIQLLFTYCESVGYLFGGNSQHVFKFLLKCT